MADRGEVLRDSDELLIKPNNCTLQRNTKIGLSKHDMIELLSQLEAELQAKDITIATLQAEKAKQFLYQAKYGRFRMVEPFHALQRDSELSGDVSFDESAIKAMYDDQLMQLENLITTQHTSQQQMREQLSAVEKRYHKTCTELEELKLKHSHDMEQGDNVTYMLEKERERLKQELDYEKSQGKKMEKELKKSTSNQGEDRAMASKHKQVAVMLIKERASLVEKVLELRQHCVVLTAELAAERARVEELQGERSADQTPAVPSANRTTSEAELERRLHEFDFEREQLRAKLAKCEAQNQDLCVELARLRATSVSGETISPYVEKKAGPERVAPVTPARHPHTYISERTVSPSPLTNSVVQSKSSIPAKSCVESSASPRRPVSSAATTSKLSPDSVEANSSVGNVLSTRGANVVRHPPPTQLSRPSLEPRTVHTGSTEPGCRISQPTAAPGPLQKKLSPMGRGFPPPIPPNKPQVFMTSVTSVLSRSAVEGSVRLQQPVNKTNAMAPVKDRISLSTPLNSTTETVSGMNSVSHMRPSTGSISHAVESSTERSKASPQVCVNIK